MAGGNRVAAGRPRPGGGPGARRHLRSQRQIAGGDSRHPLALRRSDADSRRRRCRAEAGDRDAGAQPGRGVRQAQFAQALCLAEAAFDPAGAIRRQPARDPWAAVRARDPPRLSLWRPRRPCRRLCRDRQRGARRDRARPRRHPFGAKCAAAALDRYSHAIHPARGTAAGRRRLHRQGRRRSDHGRQQRRDPGDGVAAGFRPEPPRCARPRPSECVGGRTDVRPRHPGRLRDRLGLQDLHHGDGARFGCHDDDRGVRRDLSDPYWPLHDLRLPPQASPAKRCPKF